MKDYRVILNYVDKNKEIVLRAPNIRFLKSILDKMLITEKELVYVYFSTCKGYYAKAHHQSWFYSRCK